MSNTRLRWYRRAGGRTALLLLAVGLLARVAFVLSTPHYTPRVDPGDYLNTARAIARSGVYPTPTVWVKWRGCPPLSGLPQTPCVAKPHAPGAKLISRPTAYRPPGYPYALAAPEVLARWFGGDALSFARGFQVLVGVLDVALIGLLARMLWGARVGLVALGLSAAYIPYVLVSGTLISEPLYVALMLGALCCVLRWRARGSPAALAVAGVLAGLSVLTRSNGLVVLVGVAAIAVAVSPFRRWLHRVGVAALVLACGALTIAPWVIRNHAELGQWVLSTEDGGTLVGTWNPTSWKDRSEPANWLSLDHIARYQTLFVQQWAHPETAIDSALRRDALNFATAHPSYVATVLWHNTLRLFELDGFRRTRFTASTIDLPGGPAVAAAIMLYPVALLAVAGAFAPAARRAPRTLWLLFALQFLSTVLVTSETPRFRTPLEPFILLLAALAIERLAGRLGGFGHGGGSKAELPSDESTRASAPEAGSFSPSSP